VIISTDGSPARYNSPGTAAAFSGPFGLSLDLGGAALLVADTGAHAIRRLSLASGAVVTLAGGSWGSTDGVGTAARFAAPYGVAVDT
jgi:hypothetical protein